MESGHIREFLTLAQMENYNDAAELLFISQSALFKHIKALENEIGVTLFTRKGNHIKISDYGKLFLPCAEEVTASLDRFTSLVEKTCSEKSNILQIGASYRVTDLVAKFRQINSNYIIRLMEKGEPVDVMFKNGCEIVFAANLDDTEDQYISFAYANDYLGVALHPSHRFANRASINIAELKDENFIALSYEKNSNDPLIMLCENAGFSPKIVMNSMTGSEITRMVAEGYGIGVIRSLSTPKNGTVIVRLEPRFEYRVCVCYKKNAHLSVAARAFIAFVKEYGVPETT